MPNLSSTEVAPKRRKITPTLVGWVIMAGLVALGVVAGVRRWEDLRTAGALLTFGHLATASLANVLGNFLLVSAWRRLLASGTDVPRTATVARIWSTAQLSRYTISAATFGARPLVARGYGLPLGLSTATTFLEAIWLVSINGLVVLLTTPLWIGAIPGSSALAVAAVVTVAILVSIGFIPGLLAHGGRLIARFLPASKRQRFVNAMSSVGTLPTRTALTLSAQYTVTYTIRFLAFIVLLAPSIGGELTARRVLIALAAFAVGRLGGSLAMVVPAGIGPKEGLTAALLTVEFGVGPAIIVVTAARLTEIVGEMIFFGGARALGDSPTVAVEALDESSDEAAQPAEDEA